MALEQWRIESRTVCTGIKGFRGSLRLGGSMEEHHLPGYMQFVCPTDVMKHVTS